MWVRLVSGMWDPLSEVLKKLNEKFIGGWTKIVNESLLVDGWSIIT